MKLPLIELAPTGDYRRLNEVGTSRSGNWGHAGIPGQQGGSAPGSGGIGYVSAKLGDGTPFEEFPAFKEAGTDYNYTVAGQEDGDGYLSLIQRDQGFDGPAELVDDLTPFIEQGEIEIWRGEAKAGYVEQFKTGILFAGEGIMGDGTYTAVNREVADGYSNHEPERQLHMTLRKDARLIDYEVLKGKMIEALPPHVRKVKDEYARRVKEAGKDTKQFTKARKWLEKQNLEVNVLEDPGRWAAAHGYDAIRVKRDYPTRLPGDYVVVLNRTSLRIEHKSIKEGRTESLLPYARAFLALYAHRPSPAALRGCIAVWRALKGNTMQEAEHSARATFDYNIDNWAKLAAYTQPGLPGRTDPLERRFMDGMSQTLSDGLTAAWEEGAASVGIDKDEISDEEYAACGDFIAEQAGYLPDYFTWLRGAKANDIPKESWLARAALWKNLWNAAVTKGKLMAGLDQKFRWQVGDTEHCVDCAKLDGRVYRGSVWAKAGIEPQSRLLSCSGFRCACSLVPTNERVTPGKPPALVGPK